MAGEAPLFKVTALSMLSLFGEVNSPPLQEEKGTPVRALAHTPYSPACCAEINICTAKQTEKRGRTSKQKRPLVHEADWHD